MQNETLRKAFGARLKEMRKQKNWPQKELAALVDIHFQQFNKYESGLNTPPTEMLIKLADALEALAPDDQETVIEVIDPMIAKQRVTSALTSVDVQP